MNFDVITVGSAGFDIFVSGKELKSGLLQSGDHITLQNNQNYQVEHAVYETGGSALNSAITFARQGIKTACIAKTGRDHLANQIKIVARHEGVAHELFVSNPQHHTDLRFHITTDRAEEINFDYFNSLRSLRGKDLSFPGLKTRLLYLAELPADSKLTKYFLLWAKTNGAQVGLHIKTFDGYKNKQIDYVIGKVNRLIIPIKLLEYFGFGTNDIYEALRYLKGLGVNRCVLYDELDSSYAFEDDTVYETGIYKKTNPIDMTGASDVYAASYMSALFQQKSIPEALTLASANACSVMSVMGARSGVLRKPALRTIKTTTNIL